ncbi:bumetanide-sensitive sodium-(potassium)-chloride cotransporter-like [Oppia nitens]|uniref:bumetanide-sensitive sodium-(potassium)-chloride cotransporter-like n=1 Tax=Oppia nitens TaxID=1686743 RepID=UPI0023DC3988|nr:bumetanide-sensitive sodium-(potassium)-chloride cotransporter-like [Oppia nitens]
MTEDSLKLDISAAQLHKNLSDSEVLSSESNQTSSADVIPHITHYLKKNDTKYMPRPSIRQLHENHISHNIKDLFNDKSCPNKYLNIDESNKFGFISMVYIPTFMNLLGPSLFIRMGLVTANSGLFLALVEILLGTIILCGTVLSISALCSNGRVGCGGLYYLVSRNLGPEVGAVFGVIYFLTNAVMVSYSIAGITNQIQQILQDFNTALIPFFGLDFQAKTQWFLFAFVLLAIIDFIIGAFIPPTPYQKVNGFVGWSARASKDNLIPVWESGIDFFAMFSIYMSGLCGDFTGVTMAEHLKNPKKAIPLGTLLAIITSQIIYIIQIIFYSCSVIRYATGKLDDYKFGNYSCTNQQPDCSSGLSNNEYIMSVMSALTHVGENTNYIEPIFTAGVLSQSISSALIAYITAPRVIQSLGFDGLLPYSKWFSKPYGRHGDPRRAYILTFFVSAIFVSISDFTPLAVTTTLCYLCAWFLINMSCFHTDYVASANWRPTFKYYNKWLSLIIGLLCIVVIFITKWYIGVILVAIMIFVYVFKISIWKSEANNHMNLVSMADQITRHRGMLFIGDIISQRIPFESRIKTSEEWNKCNGSDMLIQCCGFSSYLSPNIVMIGFRNSWKQCSSDDINDYFNTIQ